MITCLVGMIETDRLLKDRAMIKIEGKVRELTPAGLLALAPILGGTTPTNNNQTTRLVIRVASTKDRITLGFIGTTSTSP